MRSDEDWDRFSHYDLAHLTRCQLLVEHQQLHARLRIETSPCPWLTDRLARIMEALGD
jgi:hypothetical protein